MKKQKKSSVISKVQAQACVDLGNAGLTKVAQGIAATKEGKVLEIRGNAAAIFTLYKKYNGDSEKIFAEAQKLLKAKRIETNNLKSLVSKNCLYARRLQECGIRI
jgi:hypothetical protein